MQSVPSINTLWRFQGKPGHAATHKVVLHLQSEDGLEIITISGPHHSWLGTAEDFKKQFKYIGEAA